MRSSGWPDAKRFPSGSRCSPGKAAAGFCRPLQRGVPAGADLEAGGCARMKAQAFIAAWLRDMFEALLIWHPTMNWMIMKAAAPSPRLPTVASALVRAFALSALALPAMAQMPSPASCGGLGNGDNGPFDFRNERHKIYAGEGAHFNRDVETLRRGQSSTVGADIDYLLHMYPNHPRALVSMMGWGEKLKTPKPPDTRHSIECYFERALRFRPDDNVVRMIYALFLSKNARHPEAIQHLDRVSAAAGENAFTHYNAGLLYFDIKQYDKSAERARAAMALGFSRPELIDKLKAVGKWAEPVAESSTPAPAASAASASAPS